MTVAASQTPPPTNHRQTPAPPPRPPLGSLDAFYDAIRDATRSPQTWEQTALSVAAQAAIFLPQKLQVLSRVPVKARHGHHRSQLLHVEPDGTFSVVVLLSGPGQATSIHDHTTWCVVALVSGTEYEERFRLDPTGGYLTPTGTSTQQCGSVTALAPPGDIHRVSNPGIRLAVSLHIYGTDLRRTTNSVRRTYHQPVRDHT